jgi:peptidoglycan LD-endopeptidase LytH
MRTFRILFAGWIIGAAVIVLLTMLQPRAKAQTRGHGAPSVAVTPATGDPEPVLIQINPHHAREVMVPVAGVHTSDLQDNYLQLRGGGTRTHGAIDIMAPRGTPVLAAVNGKIRKLFVSEGGGLTIYQFDEREERVYFYAHLDRYEPGLHEGMFVGQATVIGYVGTTGNAAPDAPHLHFAIEILPPDKAWSKGTPVNPYPILLGAPNVTRASSALP